MNKEPRKGFTLVELSLSIAFIAILAIAVMLIIRDTVASYHRGLMLGQINTAGVDITDEIRASVQGSSPRAVTAECATVYGDSSGSSAEDAIKACEEDGAHNFVSVVRLATVNGEGGVPVFGAFCTGNYTYIWNSGYFWNEDARFIPANVAGSAKLRYRFGEEGNGEVREESGFRLLKVKDEARAVCVSAVRNGKNNYISRINNPKRIVKSPIP